MSTFIKLYAKITPNDGSEIWYTSFLQQHATPEKDIIHFNKVAAKKGLKCTYELATAESYFAYREFVKSEIKRLNDEKAAN